MTNLTADRRGVVSRRNQPIVRPSMPDMTKDRLGGHKQYAGSEALALAQANKNKPWARRWLRAHGYWL